MVPFERKEAQNIRGECIMCVIGIYENNFPKAEDLISMESLNSHGAGVSWIKDGWVYWKKGITAKDIIMDIKLGEIVLPMIVHFRIRSQGKKVRELTHPFKIHEGHDNFLSGKTKKGVLFHNGTIEEWKELLLDSISGSRTKVPNGELSDSRALAFLVARHGSNYLSLMEGDNKFAVMTPKGIEKFGEWKDLEDKENKSKALVSNTYWRNWGKFTNSYLIRRSQGLEADEDEQEILTGYTPAKQTSKTPIQSIQHRPERTENKNQKIPKRIRHDYQKKGIEGLTEGQLDILYESFNPNLLSWSQWGIYDEMLEMGYDKKYLAKLYYENGKDFQVVRNNIWFDQYDQINGM